MDGGCFLDSFLETDHYKSQNLTLQAGSMKYANVLAHPIMSVKLRSITSHASKLYVAGSNMLATVAGLAILFRRDMA